MWRRRRARGAGTTRGFPADRIGDARRALGSETAALSSPLADAHRIIARFARTQEACGADDRVAVLSDSPGVLDTYRLAADAALRAMMLAADDPEVATLADVQIVACDSMFRTRGARELPRLALAFAAAAFERLDSEAWDEARDLAENGVRCLAEATTDDPTQLPPTLALCREAAARAEMALGDHESAAMHLGFALAAFDRMLERDERHRDDRHACRRLLTSARAAQVRNGSTPGPAVPADPSPTEDGSIDATAGSRGHEAPASSVDPSPEAVPDDASGGAPDPTRLPPPGEPLIQAPPGDAPDRSLDPAFRAPPDEPPVDPSDASLRPPAHVARDGSLDTTQDGEDEADHDDPASRPRHLAPSGRDRQRQRRA